MKIAATMATAAAAAALAACLAACDVSAAQPATHQAATNQPAAPASSRAATQQAPAQASARTPAAARTTAAQTAAMNRWYSGATVVQAASVCGDVARVYSDNVAVNSGSGSSRGAGKNHAMNTASVSTLLNTVGGRDHAYGPC